MENTTRTLRRPAWRSHLVVQLSMLTPVVLAALASMQSVLPGLQSVLNPWTYAAASVVLSTALSALHIAAVRYRVEAYEGEHDEQPSGDAQ
ncbi:hypothetical protein [Burkholderia cepacia]|uniref:hypothetical protein n=1 Tax=Burkholderia cepacia TaxID=292 RepID=UPI0012D90242|nr:hypothetical protein [Burkholderia cepacia]